MTLKRTARIYCITGLSGMGDQFWMPPMKWPAVNSREMTAETRSQIVALMYGPPVVRPARRHFGGCESWSWSLSVGFGVGATAGGASEGGALAGVAAAGAG